MDLAGWSKGICPICGAPPLLSELSETEGRRMLICSLCGYRWKGIRTACPFCETEDQKAHRYLFVEGDNTVRIDVCDACKKYIKTIDSRNMGQKIFPLLEHMGTHYYCYNNSCFSICIPLRPALLFDTVPGYAPPSLPACQPAGKQSSWTW